MCHRVIHVFLSALASSLVTVCRAGLRPPIVHKRHHKPHHSMFSADPAPCPCVTNGQPVIKDGLLSDEPAEGNIAMKGPIIKGLDNNGSEAYFPADYGNTCQSWDRITDPECNQELPPAYCSTRWCWVSSECGKPDTQKTWRFPGSELYYSYEACGSFDAFSSYKCHDHDKRSDCIEDVMEDRYISKGPRCEWTDEIKGKELAKGEQICQPNRCQCTGEYLPLAGDDVEKELYGSKCDSWDQKKCKEWQHEPGAKMGIWCCQSWCYVDASCPSAAPSVTKPELYYSYVACEDSPEQLKQCPWPQAIGWQGSPAVLSDPARKALADPKPVPEKKKTISGLKVLLDLFEYPVAWGILIVIIAAIIFCCFKFCWCRTQTHSADSDWVAPYN